MLRLIRVCLRTADLDISRLLGPRGSPSKTPTTRSPTPTSKAATTGLAISNPRHAWASSSRPGSSETTAQLQGIQHLNFGPYSDSPSTQQNAAQYGHSLNPGSSLGTGSEVIGGQGHSMTAKRAASTQSHALESPVKKSTKWSAEENALITELRGNKMKWDEIAQRLPGRSTLSCRLHYQNFLERRAEWDEEKKTKLSRLYDRRVLCCRRISRAGTNNFTG